MTAMLDIHKGGEVVGHAMVDDVDFLWASQYRWHLNNGYAARTQRRGLDCKVTRIYLHREILGLKHGYSGVLVDHIDGDPMNNLRENLRRVTAAENCRNRRSYENSTSRYSGVSWYTAKGCWRVQVMVDGHRTLVGYFDDEDEAGRAAEAFRAQHVPGWMPRAATAESQGPVTAPAGPELTTLTSMED